MRAAYRFYDNEQVTPGKILEPHRKATQERLKAHSIVLAVQDTTQIDLTAHPHTQGTGYLQDLEHTGFLLHSTLMVTPDRQVLGLTQQQVWIRDPQEFGKRHTRHTRPTDQKESQKWLDSLKMMVEIQKGLPDTQLISVGDSEADLYPLFREAQALGGFFLIRACRDRLIVSEEEAHLWQNLERQPCLGTVEVSLSRQANRPERNATLSIRLMWMTLKAPVREQKREPRTVSGWAILVREESVPPTGEPVEWRLITNVPTSNLVQAQERIGWYSCRWVVEMFHRVLKSGCRIEKRQFDDLENTKRFLALDSIVAWRVLYLTLTGRQTPEASCEELLEPFEWQALYCFIHKTLSPPTLPPSLNQVTRWIAQLGGFSAAKSVQPGTTVIWRGLQHLTDIAQAWLLFHESP